MKTVAKLIIIAIFLTTLLINPGYAEERPVIDCAALLTEVQVEAACGKAVTMSDMYQKWMGSNTVCSLRYWVKKYSGPELLLIISDHKTPQNAIKYVTIGSVLDNPKATYKEISGVGDKARISSSEIMGKIKEVVEFQKGRLLVGLSTGGVSFPGLLCTTEQMTGLAKIVNEKLP